MRVSTATQAQEGDSIPAQRDALTRYINQHDDMILAGEYLDDGVSGTKSDRDELQRMLSDVKDGKIDLLICTKLDRLHRGLYNFLTMQRTLDKYGVNWLAIWEPIYDTSTPQGRLIINQMMSIAQFEAENTGQRIRQVQAYKVSQGEVISGSVPPGYSIVGKKLQPNQDAETVREMFEYYAMCGNLSKTMGQFDHTGVFPRTKAAYKNILKNEKYVGRLRDNTAFCPPIIPQALFNDVQRKLQINVKCSQKRVYLFSGLIRCAECGRVMASSFRHMKCGKVVDQSLYRCKGHYGSQVKRCGNSKMINEVLLEKYLLSNIKTEMQSWIIEQEIAQKPQKDNSARIAYLEKRISKLKELFINDLVTIEEYKQEKESAQAEIDSLTALQPQTDTDLSRLKDFIQLDIESLYKPLNAEERRTFWRSIFREIQFDRDRNFKFIFLESDSTN